MKKALVFGGSGFVGSFLLAELLENSDYSQVIAVSRKDLGIDHPKLRTVIGDYRSLPDIKGALEADEVFIALGTTKKNTPDMVEYYHIDHDYPVLAAKLALEKGASSVFLVSAVSASVNSGVFYSRTKGEAERDIIALGYPHTHIFQPSVILGDRKENRPMEKLLRAVWRVLDPLFVLGLRRYRGMEAKDIAGAMILAAKLQSGKVAFYTWKEMHALLRAGQSQS